MKLKEIEASLSKQQFMRLLWGLGELEMVYSHDFYKRISEVILSPKSKSSGINMLNLKDI
jgi:hypothetical protein